MRTLALIARAGAVVVLVAVGVGVLVDADPRPAVVETPVATTPDAGATDAPDEPVVPRRDGPTALVTFALAGDIRFAPGSDVLSRSGALFGDVQADLAGDVVVGVLDGDVSARQARALRRAGFTVLALADPTGAAAAAAADTLVSAGLQSAGRPGRLTVQRVAGVRVAILGVGSGSETEKDVREAAALADVVVVALRLESSSPGGSVAPAARRVARAAVRGGADLVLGHGGSGLQGMEWVGGRLVAYGLGAFAGGAGDTPAAILRLTLRDDGTYETGLLVATTWGASGRALLDPAESAHGVVRARSAAFGPRAVEIAPDGVVRR